MSVSTTKKLAVWLPLVKDLRNQGVDLVSITNAGATFQSTGGKLGGCYKSDGASSLRILTRSWMTFRPENSFSVALWHKGTAMSSISYIFACTAFELRITTSYIRIGWGGSCNEPAIASMTVDPNTWYHIAFTWDGPTKMLKLYINGELKGSSNVVGSVPTSISDTMKCTYNGTRYINDLRIYSYALSNSLCVELSRGIVGHWLGNDPWVEGTTNLMGSISDFSNTKWRLSNVNGTPPEKLSNGNIVLKGKTGSTQSYTTSSSFGYTKINPNTTYTISVNASISEGARFIMYFYEKDESGAAVRMSIYTFTTSNNRFDKQSFTVTTAANTTLMYVELNNNSGTTGSTVEMANHSLLLEAKDHATMYTNSIRQAFLGDVSGLERNSSSLSAKITLDASTPRYDKCLKMNNGTITIPDKCIYTNTYSVSYWIYNHDWTRSDSNYHIITCGSWFIYRDHGSTVAYTCAIPTTSGSTAFVSMYNASTSGYKDGWNHVVVTADGSTVIVYLNGNIVRLQSVATVPWNDTSIQIGPGYSDCKLSDIRIYAVALDSQSILELYNLGKK